MSPFFRLLTSDLRHLTSDVRLLTSDLRHLTSVLCLLLLTLTAGGQDRGRVLRVIDGDTLVVLTSRGDRETIRLLGVDAPELRAPGGPEAKAFLTKLADGKRVWIEGTRHDRYRRRLATLRVFYSRQTLQQHLLRTRHAGPFPPR